jgi:hypothetical protein
VGSFEISQSQAEKTPARKGDERSSDDTRDESMPTGISRPLF